MKAVYDTNVLISALAFQGVVRRVWELVAEGRVRHFTSDFILKELFKNLDKVGLAKPDIYRLIEEVVDHSVLIKPESRVRAIKSCDADNRILECALDAGADVLVTGNMKHIKPLGSYRGILILTPREFLERVVSGEK